MYGVYSKNIYIMIYSWGEYRKINKNSLSLSLIFYYNICEVQRTRTWKFVTTT